MFGAVIHREEFTLAEKKTIGSSFKKTSPEFPMRKIRKRNIKFPIKFIPQKICCNIYQRIYYEWVLTS